MPLFFVFAFSLSYLLTLLAGRVARRYGVVEFPGSRKVHEGIIPRFGGVAIFVAFVLAITGYNLWFHRSGRSPLSGSCVFREPWCFP